MNIEGQGHFFTINFPGFVYLCFTRPRYQVSVYRTIGPLVYHVTSSTTVNRSRAQVKMIISVILLLAVMSNLNYMLSARQERCDIKAASCKQWNSGKA